MDSQLLSRVEPGRGAMPGKGAQKTKWALPSDWQAQKQRIVELYKHQHHPLRKVMHIMEKEHGFFATTKMYKTHLHQWGIHKNLRATKVQEFLQKAPQVEEGETSEFFIGGVKVDQQKLEKYIKRVTRSRNGGTGAPSSSSPTALSSRADSRTPSPEQEFLHSYQPEFEKILHAMRNYVSGSLDSGRWTESYIPWQNDSLISSHNTAWSAGRLMNMGRIAQSFRLLNVCLDTSIYLLAHQSPRLPLDMYAALFEFAKRHQGLARSIMLFLRDLAMVTHRSNQHPIYIMFDTMSRMTPQQGCDCAWPLQEGYHEVLSTELGSGPAFEGQLTSMYGKGLSWVAAYMPVKDFEAEQALQEHAKVSSSRGQTTFEALEARLRLANFLLDRRRCGEAKRIAEEVVVLALARDGDTGTEYAYIIDDCYRILFWVSHYEDPAEDAIAAAGRWAEYCTTRLGRSHELTVDALGEVAEYLRRNGDSQAASEACRDYEAAIDDMCERFEQVGMMEEGHPTPKRTMMYGRTAQLGTSAPIEIPDMFFGTEK